MKKRYFFIITLLIILLDQTIKKIVITVMNPSEIKNFLGQVVRLNYQTNKGGAFSIRRRKYTYNYYTCYYYYRHCNMVFNKEL